MDNIRLNAIIIDDEQDSIDAIETIINDYCKNVSIVAKTTEPPEGVKEIMQKKPQLVFLDIEMPHMNGFQVLESIPERKFEVIFITAYNHYAIKAFKASAIDYILKPVNIPEFINAVNKVVHKYEKQSLIEDNYESFFENLRSFKRKRISLSTSDGTELIYTDEIIKVAADGSYSNIYILNRKPLLVSKNLKEIESMLDKDTFFRPHKSFLVNLSHIKKYNLHSGSEVELTDGSKVVVSRRKKDEFLKKMKDLLS